MRGGEVAGRPGLRRRALGTDRRFSHRIDCQPQLRERGSEKGTGSETGTQIVLYPKAAGDRGSARF